MKIALPLSDDMLAKHFGRAATFAFFNADPERKIILSREDIPAPPHLPEFLPAWLAERDVTLVIAGGMGNRAMELFAQRHIQTVVGAETQYPEVLITHYFNGTIRTGENVCRDCFTVCIKNPPRI